MPTPGKDLGLNELGTCFTAFANLAAYDGATHLTLSWISVHRVLPVVDTSDSFEEMRASLTSGKFDACYTLLRALPRSPSAALIAKDMNDAVSLYYSLYAPRCPYSADLLIVHSPNQILTNFLIDLAPPLAGVPLLPLPYHKKDYSKILLLAEEEKVIAADKELKRYIKSLKLKLDNVKVPDPEPLITPLGFRILLLIQHLVDIRSRQLCQPVRQALLSHVQPIPLFSCLDEFGWSALAVYLGDKELTDGSLCSTATAVDCTQVSASVQLESSSLISPSSLSAHTYSAAMDGAAGTTDVISSSFSATTPASDAQAINSNSKTSSSVPSSHDVLCSYPAPEIIPSMGITTLLCSQGPKRRVPLASPPPFALDDIPSMIPFLTHGKATPAVPPAPPPFLDAFTSGPLSRNPTATSHRTSKNIPPASVSWLPPNTSLTSPIDGQGLSSEISLFSFCTNITVPSYQLYCPPFAGSIDTPAPLYMKRVPRHFGDSVAQSIEGSNGKKKKKSKQQSMGPDTSAIANANTNEEQKLQSSIKPSPPVALDTPSHSLSASKTSPAGPSVESSTADKALDSVSSCTDLRAKRLLGLTALRYVP